MNSCTACRQGKRRCDRVRPYCSTCARVGRACVYDEDATSSSSNVVRSLAGSRPTTLPPPLAPSSIQLPNPLTNFDPLESDSLRQPYINAAVFTEVIKHLGSLDNISNICSTYFKTIGKRLPIISQHRFQSRLPSLSVSSPASFTALCLCMHLMLQAPSINGELDCMRSTLYVMVKSIVSLMEGTGYNDLEAVQYRVMVAWYEMGHGIHPAASISIGGCARLARAIGLDEEVEEERWSEDGRIEVEERRRVWWAVVNLERYINLCTNDRILITRDFTSSSPIPIDDDLWAQNIIPTPPPHILSTPSSHEVGVFARECQVTHLAGLVIRHIHDATLDATFQAEQAEQLERTLTAFMPLLLEDGITYGKYCVALGICSSALYTLNDARARRSQTPESEILQKSEGISTAVSQFTYRLFADPALIDFPQLSPYIPYCTYQSAVVQRMAWKRGGEAVCKERLEWLRRVLECFDRRWRVAGKYLRVLEGEDPPLVLSLQV